ncbi:MAG: hypothetical protein KGP14_03770 [Betaproteobacteria bacterium]|nr:hypothetical protein [Betaproteobacteria bacterium]
MINAQAALSMNDPTQSYNRLSSLQPPSSPVMANRLQSAAQPANLQDQINAAWDQTPTDSMAAQIQQLLQTTPGLVAPWARGR